MDSLAGLQIATIVAMIAAAAFVQGYSGFGFGIIATSLIAFLDVPMANVAAVVTLAALVGTVVLLAASHAQGGVEWKYGLIVLSGTAVGQPLGYWFIHACGDRPVFCVLLGVVLCLFGLYGLGAPRVRRRLGARWGVSAGLLGGFLGGAFVTGGPPVVAYLYSQTEDPRRMKATIQFVFITGLLYRTVWAVVAGDMTGGMLRLAGMALPVAVPVLVVAHRLSKYGSAELFRRTVYALIMLMGLGVLVRGLSA